MSRPFIPRDKPKSWVIFICAVLVALLGFGPMGFLGGVFDVRPLYYLGVSGFVACWVVGVIAWFVFAAGLATGKYRNLPARSWNEQVW